MLEGEQLLPPLCPVIQPCCSVSPAAEQNLELHLQFTLHASLILNLWGWFDEVDREAWVRRMAL